MRNTRKILVALLVLMTILVSLVAVAIPASAAAPEKLYLTPNSNWKVDNARFAAYFFGNGEKWVSMTYNADLGVYEVDVPAGYPSVIFCRMNPNASANNWNNKWNQTADLTVPTNGTNHYTVKESTWDKGGGTWGTLIIDSGECAHTNVTTDEAAATCTTDGYKKVFCSDCEQYTVNESYPALGHTYSNGTDNECNVCSAAATWTVAGSGAHMGTEWDTGNKANDMTLVDGVYTKVYTNVAAGSYALKCLRDHDWGTAYPSADKAYTVATAGSTVTVTLKGTTVTVTVEAPHVHSWSDATCTELSKCECGETQGELAAHNYVEGVCSVCGAEDPNYVPPCEHIYFYPCDKVCMDCGELSNPDADHTIVHVDAVPATCEALGNIEYWYCSDCGYAWADEALTQQTNRMSIIVPMGDHSFVEGVCSVCNEVDPNYVPPHEHAWSDATCTDPQKCECGETQGEALGHTPGAEPTCTVAQTCTVCGTELAAKLGHLDENLDTHCDREGCTGRPVPPTESHVSNFTANHLATISTSNMYYVEGVIVEVLDQKNGIFLIDDGTGETFYFRLPKDAEGVSHASWEIKLTLGDKVQVYGKINKYSTNTAPNGQYWPAIQSGVVTVLEQHAHVAANEPVCTKDTLCACGATVAPATGHIDADNSGLCDSCNWDMNLVEVNIAIGTDAKYNGVVTNGDDDKALYWTWTAENFDAIIHKGTSTVTVYTTAKDYMQLKKQNTLTIVNKEDVTVKYVVISVTNATYLGYLKTALESQYEYTADEVNFTVTIQLNSTEDFVMENKASNTIYVNGVTIVYAKKGAHVHEFVGNVTTDPTCTEAGVKTFTCECGEGTYTEAIEALGHVFVKGVCSVCGAEDPDYVPVCEHKDTGLDAKCDLCGMWFLPESPFKLEMYQASKQETYYFTGSMSGYYFASSTDISKAVDLYAEEVDGGYNVYFMSGSTKNYLYIELSGTHINAKFGSTQAVWYVDPTYGALVTELDGTKYFLGTYSSYVTFGGTAYSRLTDSTADVSQYIGRAVSLEDHVCANTTPTVTAPTCTEQGYTTYKCADCGLSTKGDYVNALGHKYENCVCTGCQAVLPTLQVPDSFDFTTEAKFNEVVASGKLVFVGSFRDNGGSYQFNTNSNIQFVVPANTTVTLTGHSTQYGVFNVSINGEVTKMEGTLTFTATEETKVVISTGDNGASYSYLASIVLEEYVDRTITADTTVTFGSEGNYKDSIVDFSGIQIGDNGGNNSQVKNGSFELILKAGSKVVIHGYPGYTSYKLNDGEAIESEYYTYLALTDMVLTVTPVSGNNYFYSIEITLHEGVELVEAKDATCTAAGYNAHYVCTCHEAPLTEKVEVEALGHTAGAEATCTAAQTCTACSTELVAALGHTAGAEATCTAAQTCTACGTELVAALGHDMLTHTETLPTCTEAGVSAGEACSRCDHETGFEEIEALGHDFAEGQCTRCGEKDPDYVPEEKPEDEEPKDEEPEEEPKDEEPEVELTLMEKIMQTLNQLIAMITAWLNNLLANFKK